MILIATCIIIAVVLALIVILWPRAIKFELHSYEFVESPMPPPYGVSLMMRYNTTGDVEVHLYDPTGKEIVSNYLAENTQECIMGLNFTPQAGVYTLVIKPWFGEETVFQKYLSFSGYNLSVASFTPTWSYYSNYLCYDLSGFTLEVRNDGDLPVEPYIADVTIGGKTENYYRLQVEWVMPNQKKSVPSLPLIKFTPERALVSGVSYQASVRVKDFNGNILATYSTSVIVSA